jgi:isoleucyl-tRNA synthetase
VAPQEVSNTLGAEILRLWVAATDYSGELSISNEILKRVVESYRRVRNTLRFLLANVADFDVARHAVPVAQMTEIDRYMLAFAASFQEELAADYAAYQFHLVAQKLQNFCSEDLGGFYLDILKDRLYTCGAESPARRSAQTALWHITASLLRLMAPVLSFTAEEAWALFASPKEGSAGDSIFFHIWHTLPHVDGAEALLERWAKLRELRAPARKEIEALRVAGKVGSSLQAELELHAAGADYELLASLGEDLKFVMLTSAARVKRAPNGAALRIEVAPSAQAKCERCWHYRADVGADAAHPGICARCVSNLSGAGEERPHA